MILVTCLLIPAHLTKYRPKRNRVNSFVHGTQGKRKGRRKKRRKEGRKETAKCHSEEQGREKSNWELYLLEMCIEKE